MSTKSKTKVVKSKSGKIYEYTNKKAKALVTKSGTIYRNRVEEAKEEIRASEDLSDAEKRTLTAKLDAYVNAKHNARESTTISGFYGHIEKNKISKMFINAGWSPEEVAKANGIDVKELKDEANWKNGQFTSSTGKKFKFTFKYIGNVLKEV